ncbi:MAG: carbohydrate-binding family 9-like protein [Oscillospiraceae bacterium]|nr:carbohydrate-binding family 9-like protein [Oscillospiraceae bacterium]
MNVYKIKSKAEPCFCGVEKAYIDNSVWDRDYRPLTYAQIILVPDDAFYIKLTCHESNPLSRYTKFYDPVYTDSCMEFFANFAPEKSKLFINCEMNSLGTSLIGVGEERHNRKKLSEFTDILPQVEAVREDDRWSVTMRFELETIYKIYGKIDFTPGYEFKGNLYKCGDDTPVLHHLMWNPVETEKPDFHRPDFFGELIIE